MGDNDVMGCPESAKDGMQVFDKKRTVILLFVTADRTAAVAKCVPGNHVDVLIVKMLPLQAPLVTVPSQTVYEKNGRIRAHVTHAQGKPPPRSGMEPAQGHGVGHHGAPPPKRSCQVGKACCPSMLPAS